MDTLYWNSQVYHNINGHRISKLSVWYFTLGTRTINDYYHQFLISCKQVPVFSYNGRASESWMPLQFIQAPGHKVAKPYAQYNIIIIYNSHKHDKSQ